MDKLYDDSRVVAQQQKKKDKDRENKAKQNNKNKLAKNFTRLQECCKGAREKEVEKEI